MVSGAQRTLSEDLCLSDLSNGGIIFLARAKIAVMYGYDSKLNTKFMIKMGYLRVIARC